MIYWDTAHPNPGLTAHPAKRIKPPMPRLKAASVKSMSRRSPDLPVDQSLGNLEGKELRFGTAAGATWAALTTNTSNGSVNCMHDSLNPLAGITPLTGMWLNCIWGGVGVGLINLLIYLIVGVFIAGLMVGPHAGILGQKSRSEGNEARLAGDAGASAIDFDSGRFVRGHRLGLQHPQ